MNRSTYRFLLIFPFLLLLTLACRTISGIGEQVEDVKGTAQSVATQAVGIVTQGAPLVATLKAASTQLPDLDETVQAFTTENPEIIETLQAFSTQNPSLVQTVQAVATQGFHLGEAPEDIPLPAENEIRTFFASEDFISFSTSADYQSVIDFYKQNMPLAGWESDQGPSFELGPTALLTFQKPDKTAVISITNNTENNSTVVLIYINPK